MIRVFIATGPTWAAHEPVLRHSILKHSSANVDIHFIDPVLHGMQNTGCTGFTNVRWAVPHLAGRGGFAIYLDIDMLLLAPIEELFDYRRVGAASVLQSGSNEVIVWDCTLAWKLPHPRDLHKHHKSALARMVPQMKVIPDEWNCQDEYHIGTKLLHFTDLKRQPWLHPELNRTGPEMTILRQYEQEARNES